MIALGATIPTQPPIACKKRKAINTSTDFVNTQPMVAAIYNSNPTYNGIFLPNLSNKGPHTTWPIQIPIKKLDKEYDTISMDVCRSVAMAGKPGRYISIENGPSAESKPSIKITVVRFFAFIPEIVVLIKCKNIFSLADIGYFLKRNTNLFIVQIAFG
jgi:hypothetical protein